MIDVHSFLSLYSPATYAFPSSGRERRCYAYLPFLKAFRPAPPCDSGLTASSANLT